MLMKYIDLLFSIIQPCSTKPVFQDTQTRYAYHANWFGVYDFNSISGLLHD